MQDRQNAVQDLLNSICNSIIKIGLVIFFHQNPGALDTAEGLARWVGKKETEVKKAMDELAKTGIIEVFGEGPSAIYSYTQDEVLLKAIDKFITGFSREGSSWKNTTTLLEGE